MSALQKIRLGDLLVERKVITAEQLQQALQQQRKLGRKLGQTIIALGYASEDQILATLADQLKLEVISLRHFEFDAELVKKLPESQARRFRAIVLKENNGMLTVGMADPTDLAAYDQIRMKLRQPLQIAIVKESELLRVFDIAYRRTEQISTLASELGQELAESDTTLDSLIPVEDQSDAPVVRLLHNIFEDAVQMRASDIHIEPDEKVLRIRQRIDGILHEQVMEETRIVPALVLKLKLMASLDISEKRLPQDGRFNMTINGRNIDVRLSTMPIQYGESVVMRLLDQSGDMMNIHKLGMPDDILHRFHQAVHSPHGIILVTGPTGSGKTTTLYAALAELNDAKKKIITAEDPVEYRLPRINQVQVQPKIKLDFATILRTAMRQDPDVILVGEIRDQETAEIALRASMTGHLVLSTLHTNDAASSADRLIDMGMEGFLLAATLRAILAQRLIRKICTNCSAEYQLSSQEKQWLYHHIGDKVNTIQAKRGTGCSYCNHTGYQGRIGVYELLIPDQDMLQALRVEDSNAFHKAADRSANYKMLVNSAIDYLVDGITTIEEIFRMAGEMEMVENRQDSIEPLQSGNSS